MHVRSCDNVWTLQQLAAENYCALTTNVPRAVVITQFYEQRHSLYNSKNVTDLDVMYITQISIIL